MVAIGHKCRNCGEALTTDNIQPSRLVKGDWICNTCAALKSKQHYQENKDSILEQQQAHYELNKDEINLQQRQRYAEDEEYRKRLLDGNNRRYSEDEDFRERAKSNSRARWTAKRDELVIAGRKRYDENKGKINETKRWRYNNDPDYNSKVKAAHKKQREDNRDLIRLQKHESHRRLKFKVIDHYGGKCIYCGQTNLDFLTIGHKNNDGGKHRTEIRNTMGYSTNTFIDIYAYLIRVNFITPYELQVECWNHNDGKRRDFWDKPESECSKPQGRGKQAFLKCIKHYGGICVCCGESNVKFLTLSHKNDDGMNHIDEYGSRFSGTHFALWLVAHNFECDFEIQLECFNCNMGRESNLGVCPHKKIGVGIIEAASIPQ